MPFSLVQGPTQLPITLAEAKLYCRVTESDDDNWFENVGIPSVVSVCENLLNRSLMTQQWDLTLDEFPSGPIRLGKAPIQSINSVKYIRSDGILVTVSAADYFLDAVTMPGWVHCVYGLDWPNDLRDIANAVVVRFTAGYASAADVPAQIKHWLMCALAELYDNRGTSTDARLRPSEFVGGLLDKFVIPQI